MKTIKAIFDGKNFHPVESIPVKGKHEVVITFTRKIRSTEEILEKLGTAKKTILVVDDDLSQLKMLRVMLEKHFDLCLAKSAKIAMKILNQIDVDLILLDIEMPGISGIEFMEYLRTKRPLNKHTPVIFVTSNPSKEFVKKAIVLNAKGYILKPIDAEKLYKKIDATIGMPKNDLKNIKK